MFNLRKRVENIEDKLQENRITEEDLYKFYLERKIDEINEDKKYISLLAYPQKILNIKIDKIDIFKRECNGWKINGERSDYKIILNYLNKKSIGYFIKLDKKIEDLKKNNAELDKKKLNLEEELKKII